MGVAYYTGKYKEFYSEVPKQIPDSPIFHEKGRPLEVFVGLHLPKPGSPANCYPVGDVDNYAKSVLDAIKKNGTYWHDDAQETNLHVWKTYTTGPTGFAVTILPSPIDKSTILPSL